MLSVLVVVAGLAWIGASGLFLVSALWLWGLAYLVAGLRVYHRAGVYRR